MAVQLNAGAGGVPASADLLNATTGLNGGAPDITAEQVQRVKVGFGSDSFLRDVDADNPLPVMQGRGTPTDRAGTITTGGTAQQLAAANANRLGWWVQNNSAGDLRVNRFGTASITAGIRISAGDLYESMPGAQGVGALSIWGATTAQAFSAGEF